MGHVIQNQGVGVAHWSNPINASTTQVTSRPYLKQFVIPLARVASASAQTIAYTTISGWPTGYFGGARPTANIAAKDIIYTLGSNDWAESSLELVLTVSAVGDPT